MENYLNKTFGSIVSKIWDTTTEDRELVYFKDTVGITTLLSCPQKLKYQEILGKVGGSNWEIHFGYMFETFFKKASSQLFGLGFYDEFDLYANIYGIRINGHLDGLIIDDKNRVILGVELKFPKRIVFEGTPDHSVIFQPSITKLLMFFILEYIFAEKLGITPNHQLFNQYSTYIGKIIKSVNQNCSGIRVVSQHIINRVGGYFNNPQLLSENEKQSIEQLIQLWKEGKFNIQNIHKIISIAEPLFPTWKTKDLYDVELNCVDVNKAIQDINTLLDIYRQLVDKLPFDLIVDTEYKTYIYRKYLIQASIQKYLVYLLFRNLNPKDNYQRYERFVNYIKKSYQKWKDTPNSQLQALNLIFVLDNPALHSTKLGVRKVEILRDRVLGVNPQLQPYAKEIYVLWKIVNSITKVKFPLTPNSVKELINSFFYLVFKKGLTLDQYKLIRPFIRDYNNYKIDHTIFMVGLGVFKYYDKFVSVAYPLTYLDFDNPQLKEKFEQEFLVRLVKNFIIDKKPTSLQECIYCPYRLLGVCTYYNKVKPKIQEIRNKLIREFSTDGLNSSTGLGVSYAQLPQDIKQQIETYFFPIFDIFTSIKEFIPKDTFNSATPNPIKKLELELSDTLQKLKTETKKNSLINQIINQKLY